MKLTNQEIEIIEHLRIDAILASYIIQHKEGTLIFNSWCADDVKNQAEDDGVEITDDQVKEVLVSMQSSHDASIGISWDVISTLIDEVVNQ